MSNAQVIIDEIDTFLDRSKLKTSKLTKQDLIAFIEQKWQQADDEKYNIHQGCIIIARMTNEYIWACDFDNMMRWLAMGDLHSSSRKNADYIHNYYKGQCCLKCGNEAKALEYFRLCYAEDPDYIFTRAPLCYEFFNRHLEHPRELPAPEVDDEPHYTLKLKYWQTFFSEESAELPFAVLNKAGDRLRLFGKKTQNGLSYLRQNQQQVLTHILDALLKKYPELQAIYEYPENEKQDFMPDVTSIDGFAELLSPTGFFVLPVYKDDIPYIGFGFHCSWDSEHGLGVMTHKDEVVEIGSADVAFSFPPEKQE